jgi:hypothetical protein
MVMIENLMVHYTDQENICGISHSSALLKEYVIPHHSSVAYSWFSILEVCPGLHIISVPTLVCRTSMSAVKNNL